MPLEQLDLEVDQGSDWTNTFIFASPSPPISGGIALNANLGNAVYYDFTGAAARLQVRQANDPASAIVFSLTIGSGLAFVSAAGPSPMPPAPAHPNAIQATITKALSLAALAGAWTYDLFVDWGTGGSGASGTSTCMLQGGFILNGTVTR